jgi:putative ABC transport system substrate-binding protein
MKRRDFIALLGSATAAWPPAARAQQPGKIPVVGIIWHHAGSEKEEELTFNYFRQAFADLGYVPGKNIIFEDRYAAEIPERFGGLASICRLRLL